MLPYTGSTVCPLVEDNSPRPKPGRRADSVEGKQISYEKVTLHPAAYWRDYFSRGRSVSRGSGWGHCPGRETSVRCSHGKPVRPYVVRGFSVMRAGLFHGIVPGVLSETVGPCSDPAGIDEPKAYARQFAALTVFAETQRSRSNLFFPFLSPMKERAERGTRFAPRMPTHRVHIRYTCVQKMWFF